MSFITSAKDAQVEDFTPAVTLQPGPTSGPTALGIAATPTLVASSDPITPVAFTIYATGTVSADTPVTYTVIAPESDDFSAASFGGTLPSGTATIDAGASTTSITIDVPSGLGGEPSQILEVQITDGAGEPPIAAPTATTQVVAPAPVAGPPAQPAYEELSGPGQLTNVGQSWTLDLGSFTMGTTASPVKIGIANIASAGADSFFGNVSASGSGALLTSVAPLDTTDPGQLGETFIVSVDTGVAGSYADTFVLSPTDTNASGYSSTLPTETLTITADVMCFCINTLIATPSGNRPVHELAVGDMVTTHRGAAQRIVWVGTGRVLAVQGRRNAATPVIVRQGALADNVPNRDLRVTKGHSFYIDDVLIPVEFLVNHRSICWDDNAQEVELYHIELEAHDVLLANGAPAESYRDDGNRWLFQNANSGWGLPPQMPCAPVLTGGPIVDAAWRRLLERAGRRPGIPTTNDPDLHLMVDGRRVDAALRDRVWHVFRLPVRPGSVRIVSRSGVPQEMGLARDPRCLGVALRQIMVTRDAQMRTIEAEDALLADGFHGYEADNNIRWTDGDAGVPAGLFEGFAGPLEIALRLGGATSYPDEGTILRAA